MRTVPFAGRHCGVRQCTKGGQTAARNVVAKLQTVNYCAIITDADASRRIPYELSGPGCRGCGKITGNQGYDNGKAGEKGGGDGGVALGEAAVKRERLLTIARGGWRVLRARLSAGYRSPVGMYFNITSRCNMRCRMCSFARYNDWAGEQEIGRAAALDYIEQMAAAGVCRLSITGGEPLLHPAIDDIIAAACRQRMFVSVATNGILAGEHLAALQRCDQVMVSYEATDAVHDALRGAGTAMRVRDSFALLARHRIPFWITTVVNKLTAPHLRRSLELARELGTWANFVLIQQDVPAAAGHAACAGNDDLPDLFMPEEQIRAVFRQLLAWKRSGEPVGSTDDYLQTIIDWQDHRQVVSPAARAIRCYAGKLYGHLYFDHCLYPCGTQFMEGLGISVREFGFAGAFRRLQRPPGCGSCSVACNVENNLLYGFNLTAVANWLRKLS